MVDRAIDHPLMPKRRWFLKTALAIGAVGATYQGRSVLLCALPLIAGSAARAHSHTINPPAASRPLRATCSATCKARAACSS